MSLRKVFQISSVVLVACLLLYGLFTFLRRLTEAPILLSEEEGDGGTTEQTSDGKVSSLDLDYFNSFDKSHFGLMHPNKTYAFASELNIHWERNPFAPFIWGEVEKTEGNYDWGTLDEYVKKAQSYEIGMIATIWPYANWDQESCHEKLPSSTHPNRVDLGDYKQSPCDMSAYKRFVTALVERYDGDLKDDMVGLTYPIRYFEVMNEPEEGKDVQLLNFKGEDQAVDYLEILKATAQAIESADPRAKVLNGGIAGLGSKEWQFWETIFKGVGRDLVDIITIHAVNSPEHLQMVPIEKFKLQYLLTQPVWITEVQFGSSNLTSSLYEKNLTESLTSTVSAREVLPISSEKERSEEEWSKYLVKTFVQAFSSGAQRLFHVGLHNRRRVQNTADLVYCDDEEAVLVDNFTELDTSKCDKQKMFDAFKTLVSKIDYFEIVEKLDEGQYKFTLRKKNVYVLWGNKPLPREVKGDIRLTDIYGEIENIQAENLFLSDEPVYVELR